MTDSLTPHRTRTAHQRLIKAAQHDDHAAQHELLRRYEPLVQRVVWKLLRLPPGCERADLAQEARIGLLAAIRAWRPERGPFPAFADRCVTNQALLALKAACAHKHQVLSLATSLDAQHESHAPDDRPARALIDTLAAPPRRPRGPRNSPARSRAADQHAARPPHAHLQRARRARDLGQRTELQRLGPTLPGTPKAASQAAYRARRKLAAAIAQAA
jgi:RNA polymerase sigma factor (sigma-70 family)